MGHGIWMLWGPWKERAKQIQRAIIRHGKERARAHTHASGIIKPTLRFQCIEHCVPVQGAKNGNLWKQRWVKTGAGGVVLSGLPRAREQKRCQASPHHSSWNDSGPWAGGDPHSTYHRLTQRSQILQPCGLWETVSQADSVSLGKLFHCSGPQFSHL
jgi:hypothetical protein